MILGLVYGRTHTPIGCHGWALTFIAFIQNQASERILLATPGTASAINYQSRSRSNKDAWASTRNGTIKVITLRAWDKVVAVAAAAACGAELDGGGVVGGGGTACLNVWSHGTWRHQGFGKMADSNCDPCQLC